MMFLKLKSDEVPIKGRGCIDRSKHQDWISKEDTSPPTMSTEGLMLSCMIDTMEGREVATADIPGAFLHINYHKGDTYIKLAGAMVTLPKEINPEYYKYLSTNSNVEGGACMQNTRRLSMEP